MEGYDGEATVSWGKSSSGTKSVKVSPYSEGKYSLTLEGLSPTTAYTVDIRYDRGPISGDTKTIDFLTKASHEGGKPYIYLEYLSPYRTGGRFPSGVGLPLRVFNAIGKKVDWSYDGISVNVDGSGYFHPTKSGILKAVVHNADGSKDILSKEIIIQ